MCDTKPFSVALDAPTPKCPASAFSRLHSDDTSSTKGSVMNGTNPFSTRGPRRLTYYSEDPLFCEDFLDNTFPGLVGSTLRKKRLQTSSPVK